MRAHGRLQVVVGETAGVLAVAIAGALMGTGVRRVAGSLAGRRPPPVCCEAACLVVAILSDTASTAATTVWATTLFGGWCVCLSTVDLLVRRLPNLPTVGGALVILTVAAAAGRGGEAVVGALLLAAPLCVTHVISPRSLGAGDVKLALGLGAVAGLAGPTALLFGAVLPPFLTAGAGVLAGVIRGRWRSGTYGAGPVPHGPSMCLATGVGLLTAG